MATVASVLAMIVGGFASLLMLIMLVASMPNSSPEQSRFIGRCMWSVVVVSVLALAGAIWLLAVGKPWTSAIVGAGPVAYVMVLFIVLYNMEV